MSASLRAHVDTSRVEALVRRLDHALPDIGADALADEARSVAERARSRFPRRSGRLSGSVTVADTRDGADLTVGAPYAGWIEFGGTRGRSYVAGGRYLGPAAEGAEDRAAEEALDQIRRIT